MPSTYPTSLDSFATNRTDASAMATTHPGDHNDENDAINKIEAELGTTPSGSFTTVRERLEAIQAGVGTGSFTITGDATDLVIDVDATTFNEFLNVFATLLRKLDAAGIVDVT